MKQQNMAQETYSNFYWVGALKQFACAYIWYENLYFNFNLISGNTFLKLLVVCIFFYEVQSAYYGKLQKVHAVTVCEVLFEIVVLQCPQQTQCSKLPDGYLKFIPFILIGKSAMAFLTGHLHLTIYSNPGTEL